MTDDNLVIYEEEIEKIDSILARMLKGAEAKCALLVDKDGHLITRQGFTHSLDTTALAALLAGSFASTKEIARLVGESEFSVLFHQGKKDHIHMSIVGDRRRSHHDRYGTAVCQRGCHRTGQDFRRA